MAQNHDLDFLARSWETIEISKQKKYLFKYFDTPLQEVFLKYILVFGEYSNFSDHTGFKCSARWLETLYNRFLLLQKLHQDAKIDMDMTKLALIESGNYKL